MRRILLRRLNWFFVIVFSSLFSYPVLSQIERKSCHGIFENSKFEDPRIRSLAQRLRRASSIGWKVRNALATYAPNPDQLFWRELVESKRVLLKGNLIAASTLATLSRSLNREMAPGFRKGLYISIGKDYTVSAFAGIHTHPNTRLPVLKRKHFRFPADEVETTDENIFEISRADIRQMRINTDSQTSNFKDYIVLGDGNVISMSKSLDGGRIFIDVRVLSNPQEIYFELNSNEENPNKVNLLRQ